MRRGCAKKKKIMSRGGKESSVGLSLERKGRGRERCTMIGYEIKEPITTVRSNTRVGDGT